MSRPAPDWALLARRVVLGAAAVTTLLLLIGMVLSYSGLRAAYAGAGLAPWQAALAPLVVDLLALVAYVALLVLSGKLYPGAVVAGTVLGSATAQGYHLAHGGITAPITDGRIVALFGGSSMLCAGLAAHLLWLILARALPAAFVTELRGGDGQVDVNRPAEDSSAPASDLNPVRGEPLQAVYYDDPMPFYADGPLTWTPPPEPEPEPEPIRRVPLRSVPDTAAAPAPPRVHAKVTRTSTSQARGPCRGESWTCPHHRDDVSKSTRYKCDPRGTHECRTCYPKES